MNNNEKLKQIIADVFEVDPESITEESSQDTLDNWDSIHQLNLVFALEEAFEIQLSDEDVVQLLSVKIIISVLERNGILF